MRWEVTFKLMESVRATVIVGVNPAKPGRTLEGEKQIIDRAADLFAEGAATLYISRAQDQLATLVEGIKCIDTNHDLPELCPECCAAAIREGLARSGDVCEKCRPRKMGVDMGVPGGDRSVEQLVEVTEDGVRVVEDPPKGQSVEMVFMDEVEHPPTDSGTFPGVPSGPATTCPFITQVPVEPEGPEFRCWRCGELSRPVKGTKARCQACGQDQLKQPEPVTAIVKDCPYCGEDHGDMMFTGFKLIAGGKHTHWALCPKVKEPILHDVKDGDLSTLDDAMRKED